MILELSKASQWRADLARHGRNPELVMRGKVLRDILPTIGENEVEYEKTCKYILCGKTFFAGRKDKEFCCDAHRTAAGKMRDTREPSELSKRMAHAIEIESQFYGGPSSPESKRAREKALRDVHDAIVHELGIVQSVVLSNEPANELDEPEDDTTRDPLTNENVREKLRAFMLETRWSQRKIQDLTGVPQSTLSVFLGKDKGISEDQRRALVDLMNQDHGMDRR